MPPGTHSPGSFVPGGGAVTTWYIRTGTDWREGATWTGARGLVVAGSPPGPLAAWAAVPG